jgi:hypothetical protein
MTMASDERVREALEKDLTIDITTIGRRSRRPIRKEIWFHNLHGRIYITGSPGPRDWYANLVAQPEFTFHLKQSVTTDLPARAQAITDEAEKRRVMALILEHLKRVGDPGRRRDLDEWVARSPLVEVTFPES